MVGRPRKSGKRKPCGRLAQVYVNPKAQVASQPHRVVVPVKFRDWPEAGSFFGRLMIAGTITPAQYEAGKRYNEDYSAYQRAMQSPSPDPKAMSYEPRIAGKSDGMPDDAARRARRVWTDAFNAVEEVGMQQAVMHHAVHDKPIATERQGLQLRCALDRLIPHYGIDSDLRMTHRA